MLSQAIGGLLAPAIGVALSPIPVVAVVVVLGTPRARRTGPAFALGWVAGLVLVSVVVLALAQGADEPQSATATGVNWIEAGLGVLFLVLAALQWRKRPRRGQEPEMPRWLATVDTFGVGKVLGLGALLAMNPKNLALTAAAAASIARAGLSTGQDAVAVAVFVLVASVTVIGSVLFYVITADRAAAPLGAVKQFMADNNAVIMMVLLLVLGGLLLGQGIGALG